MNNDKLTLVNFRDMGGLETPCGKIKKGKLFRTAVIRPKTAADKALLERCRPDCVVDLRTPDEAREKPDKLPLGTEYVSASVFGDEDNVLAPTIAMIIKMLKASREDLEAVKKTMLDSYAFMPFRSAYSEIFRRMDEGKTIIFHCTAGKDRTGIAALIIELAFGRSAEQAKTEYLASNKFRKAENEKMLRRMKFIRAKDYITDFSLEASEVRGDLFDEAIASILRRYADFDEFLLQAHGIDEQRKRVWREFYVDGI